ncbi:MAG: hypothetical protein AB7O66_09215 [Limisphaerales bacterium]
MHGPLKPGFLRNAVVAMGPGASRVRHRRAKKGKCDNNKNRPLAEHGSMAPAGLWAALDISKQGAMDLLRPLLEAGLVEKIGTKKGGRYALKQR